MIFIEVSISRNKDACKYKPPRANYKQKVDCWGFLLDPQQTPHSTTTGTAGTWQQPALQQQPLLPYWKFNFVKKYPHYFSDMHMYRSDNTHFPGLRRTLSFYIWTRLRMLSERVQQSVHVWNPPGPLLSSPYVWVINPAACYTIAGCSLDHVAGWRRR